MASPADEIIGIYRRHSRAWTGARGNRLVEKKWLDGFVNLLPSCGHVLDIGCGSGEPIARYLAECGHRIVGVDSSPEMIEMFAANLPGHGAIVADMRSLSLEQRFCGVLAWDSFFHLQYEEQRAMFSVFGAHSEPAAALMFTSGPAHGEAIGTLEGEPLYHASLAPSEYVQLLDTNGFDVVAHAAEDAECDGRTVWLARRR